MFVISDFKLGAPKRSAQSFLFVSFLVCAELLFAYFFGLCRVVFCLLFLVIFCFLFSGLC